MLVAMSAGAPKQVLSLTDCIAIVVGIVIGAGIFRLPSVVSGQITDPNIALLLWFAGGLISFIGALCYAELATAFPSAGGEYHFLIRAFGRSLAFLYGWARMTGIVAGSIWGFVYFFGGYILRIGNFGAPPSAVLGALLGAGA